MAGMNTNKTTANEATTNETKMTAMPNKAQITPRRITKIEAAKAVPKTIRVAAYCRISSLIDNQLSSIENQRAHYTALINHHIGWKLADIYLEEGVTGTKKEVRPELNRLLADCRAGKIDLILTKSISRFARNVTDCLEMVRALTDLGIGLIFEKENLDTSLMGSEFILTILSSLAEEESHSISDNEKWSIQKHMKDGTFHQSKAPYGYRWSNGTNGDLIPDPVEAAVVRWIFDQVLTGCGTGLIATELNKAGIPSPQNKKWSSRTVGHIVRNPAVIGDVLMNKSYKDEAFYRRLNLGEKPLYYQDEHHEAIISRTDFENANASIFQRGKEKGNCLLSLEERVKHRDPHKNRYPFTGKLFCGECRSSFRRVIRYTKSGNRIFWECAKHHNDSHACSMKEVLEENVQNAFLTMIHKLQYAEFILDDYCESLAAEERSSQRQRLSEIQSLLQQNTGKRNRIHVLLQSGCVDPVSCHQGLIRLEEQAARLNDERNRLVENTDSPVEAFRRFVKGFSSKEPAGDASGQNDGSTSGNYTNFPAQAFTDYVERVIIHSQTCFTFVLKCGLEFTEDMVQVSGDKASVNNLSAEMREMSLNQSSAEIPVIGEKRIPTIEADDGKTNTGKPVKITDRNDNG